MTPINRRTFLSTALGSFGMAFAQTASAKPYRIDIHHHFGPPVWVAEVKGRPLLQPANTTWTPAKSIEDMDRGRRRRLGGFDHQPRFVVRRQGSHDPPRTGVQ